jgi:hypothetical protein
MPTHSPHDPTRPPRDLSEHDLRVQLEGTWEVLEQAQDQQAVLLELERPELLRLHHWPRPA